MQKMKVAGVILDSQSKHPIVLLKDQDERRALLIWIGEPEAHSILLALEGIKTPRPMTHDLLLNSIEKLGGTVSRVVVTDMRDATFFAAVEVEREGTTLEIDARPSDAIAVALRAGADLYVADAVLEANAVPLNQKDETGPADEDEDKKFKEFLDNVKPGDFGKFSKD